jgi:hypothetical protein
VDILGYVIIPSNALKYTRSKQGFMIKFFWGSVFLGDWRVSGEYQIPAYPYISWGENTREVNKASRCPYEPFKCNLRYQVKERFRQYT